MFFSMWRTTTYDRRAGLYDRMVRSRLYNRLAWGTSPDDYEDFAARALADGDGPLLDAGCGSAAATAALYRSADRQLVLADRSGAMLQLAAARIGERDGVRYVQCDLEAPPFGPREFGVVACFGVLHLVEDVPRWVSRLRALSRGRVFLSALVADRPLSRSYLHALHRAGEVATPRTAADFRAAVRAGAGGSEVDVRVRGAMAYAILGPGQHACA